MPRSGLGNGETNLERRLTRVEQILPTLATKTDLETAVAPLATKAELAAAVEQLATKEELAVVSNGLRAEIREAAEYTVQRMKTLTDEIRTEIRTEMWKFADRLAATHERTESAHERIDRLDRQVDAR